MLVARPAQDLRAGAMAQIAARDRGGAPHRRVFPTEREINGQPSDQRLAFRRLRSRPLGNELETWMRAQRRRLSAKSPLAKAFDHMLKRRPAFARFLDDGRI